MSDSAKEKQRFDDLSSSGGASETPEQQAYTQAQRLMEGLIAGLDEPAAYYKAFAAAIDAARKLGQSEAGAEALRRLDECEKRHYSHQVLLAAMAGESVMQARGYCVVALAHLIAERAAKAETELAALRSRPEREET